MSRQLNGTIRVAVLGFLTALLLSLGMSLTLLRALLPQQALWPALLFCFGFTLVFYAFPVIPLKGKGLIPLAAALGLILWALLGGGPVYAVVQMVKAVILTFQGVPDAVAPYADVARWCLCLMLSWTAAELAWDDSLPLALCTTMAVTGLSFVINSQANLLPCILPAAAGLLLILAERDSRRYSVLAVAACLVGLAFLLTPGRSTTVSPMDSVAAQVHNFVQDYLIPSETRSSFSLISEGFQPLENRLGGPVTPRNHNVMDVTCDRMVLLRGRTYNEYTGLNWYDTLSTRRYLYGSPRFAALRNQLLDLNRPLCGDTVEPLPLTIHMLDDSPTTLFAPGHTRTVQLEGQRMVLYFNQASELFLTRNLTPGDTYLLTYSPYEPGQAATEEAVNACAEMDDPFFDEVRETYLSLPSHIQQDVFDLAERVTYGLETPYEKALALQNYLRDNYRYTLNVKTPPDNVDFVAWFLIGQKEGYCTYFASAMTVLCRMVGVPARYVTGYVAIPDETGVATVTGQMAHAWTEVYLNGFGWLAFDATARSDTEQERQDRDSGRDNHPPSPQPTVPPTATPSPTPAPSPTPSPSPEQQDDGAPPTPTPPPGDNGARQTPTPPPMGAQTPTPSPGGEETKRQPPSPFLWLLMAIPLLVLLLALRYYFTEPLRRAKRKPDQATEILYSAIGGLLSMRGIARRPQETLHEFATRCDEALGPSGLPAVSPLTYAYAAQVYGKHPANARDFAAMYRTLRDAATPWARVLLTLQRMFTFRSSGNAGRKRGK